MNSKSRLPPLPLLLSLSILLVGCASTPRNPPRASVLLISIDGLRPADVTAELMPNAFRLGAEGVRAPDGMRPSFPSLTFPNHYTLVTGLRPDHHGIVQNSMLDPALGEFRLSDRKAIADGRWWGGEPVWVSVEKAGLHSATLFWPGSEAEIKGVRPARWRAFDAKMPPAQRVEAVAGWLDEPPATRPAFATLYFDSVDHAEHDHGPGSPEAQAEIRATDAAIGQLVDILRAHGTLNQVDIVLVSDHGFTAVPERQVIAVEDVVPVPVARAVSLGQLATFIPTAGHEAEAERDLLGRHAHFEGWRKSALPARWHYGGNPRVAPIVCQMDEGWDMLPRAAVAKRTPGLHGSHGFDPALPSMRATFLARGPDFIPGSQVGVFDNVDVYPLLMKLLRLRPAPNDGNPHTFDAVLKR